MENIKKEILNLIEQNVPVFKPVSDILYKIRCPICGDSKKDPNKARCYIKCGYDENEPLLYKCHNCNAQGKITSWFLRQIGIEDNNLLKNLDNQKYNKGMTVYKSVELMTGLVDMNSYQVQYINNRLGEGFTFDDYDRMKIVWDMNIIRDCINSDRIKNSLPSNNNSISFISDDRNLLITRSFIDDSMEHQWRKIRLTSSPNKSFYTMKSVIDLFTDDILTINIAEGIFDILSVYKNFSNKDNAIFIATLGSDYISALEFAMSKGIVGHNVNVCIYIDKNVDKRSLKYYLKSYKWTFKNITLYENIKSKDVGVNIDKIKLMEERI